MPDRWTTPRSEDGALDRRLERERATVRRLRTVVEAARAFARRPELSAVIETATECAGRALQARAILVLDVAATPPVIASGRDAPALDRLERGLGGLPLPREELGSLVVVPLRGGGVELGVLMAARPTGEQPFVDDDLSLLESLADQAAVAVERARLIERERAARAQAEQADRRKDEFLAMLGHELRNPLSPILTALELMRLRSDDQLRRERSIIERQVTHLVRLVDDLLDVSRITRGKVELRRRHVEVSEVVARSIEMSSPLLEERRHQLTTAVPSGLVVDGDPRRLAQVLTNLLTNAARYTPPGGCIQVRATRQDDDVVIEVRDTGAGISPELLPVLFDLFVQGERAIDRSEGGLGLGLAIVRNLVTLHGGTVSAESPGLGSGSTFRIRLPIAAQAGTGVTAAPQQQARPSAPPAAAPAESGDQGERTDRRRVLVVDDNRDAAETLADTLDYFGYDARVAFDGPGALAAAPGFEPDLALLDIGLPLMDGYELADRLRSLPGLEDLRLVAVTGYGQSSDRRRSLDAGFDDHMVKPVDPDGLRRLLARLIGEGRERGGFLGG